MSDATAGDGLFDSLLPSGRPRVLDVPVEENSHRIWGGRTATRALDITPDDGGPEVVGLLDIAHPCWLCGHSVTFDVTTERARATTPCPIPDGTTTVITLAVPSGKILVTDDLRPVYTAPREVERTLPDYNGGFGQAQYTRATADLGCAYGYVGNSCPTLYRTGPDTYVIANGAYDDDTDEVTVPDGWTDLATICTDLWAYSVADYADWCARGGNPTTLGWTDTVVDVPPGTYEFTHHTAEASFGMAADGVTVYAHVRRLP